MAGEVTGNLGTGVVRDTHCSSAMGLQKSKLEERALVSFPQKLTDFRVWDAMSSLLPAAGATDDLGIYAQTFGTTPVQVQTGDLKAAGATTRRARMIIQLPDNYVSAGDVQIRCQAGMKTTVADASCTIDVEAYEMVSDGTLSADLVTTAAQSINSLTYAAKDFTVTATDLVAGDRLDVRVTIVCTDAASATAVIGVLHDLILRCDVQP